MLAHTHQHRHQQQSGYQRIEVITGQRRRRQWSEEEKARIVAESLAPGANVSGVARRNNVSGGLLFKWRRDALQASSLAAPFIPITVTAGEPRENEVSAAASSGTIEIELAGARVRVAGAAGKAALKTVLSAFLATGGFCWPRSLSISVKAWIP